MCKTHLQRGNKSLVQALPLRARMYLATSISQINVSFLF